MITANDTEREEFDWELVDDPDDRAEVRLLLKELQANEVSELQTGMNLIAARAILEKDGLMTAFLKQLPYTMRTAFRRIKTYEKAMAMWPAAVVKAAIAKRLRVLGWADDRPMGFYENVEPPPSNLNPRQIEDYLAAAELEARRSLFNVKVVSPSEALKDCFRATEKATRTMTKAERKAFLIELVGLQMTLCEVNGSHKFDSESIPSDFWPASRGAIRSAESRAQVSASMKKRWARLKS